MFLYAIHSFNAVFVSAESSESQIALSGRSEAATGSTYNICLIQ